MRAIHCVASLLLFEAVASGQSQWWEQSGPPARSDLLGWSAAFIGDVDGDGVVDLLAGSQPGMTPGRVLLASGATGATIHEWLGAVVGDGFGWIVANAGDTDGDGIDDVLIGVPDVNGVSGAVGAIYLYSGASGALRFSIAGTHPGDLLGYSLAGVGDVDGDGSSDVIVGIPGADTALLLSGTDGSTLQTFSAAAAKTFGASVDGAGDLDLDGVPDVIVGAWNYSGGAHGGALFAYSGATGAKLFECDNPSGPPGFGFVRRGPDIDGDGRPDPIVLNGQEESVRIVSGANGAVLRSHFSNAQRTLWGPATRAGDLDGDGVDDYVIGGVDTAVRFYVFSGATGHVFRKFDDPEASFAIDGTADVTQDGVDDLLVGTPLTSWWGSEAENAGRITVRSGANLSPVLDVHGVSKQEELGNGVAILWDVDGDGVNDVAAASAPYYGLCDVTVFSGASGAAIGTVSSGVGGDRYGVALTPLGDVDGDGVPELAIGAPGTGSGPPMNGSVEIRSGGTGAILRTLAGPTLSCEFGAALASARDASGDVVLLVGAPARTIGGVDSGSVASFDLTTGVMRFEVGIPDAGARFGGALDAVGDVNGDGIVDWVVGAPNRNAAPFGGGEARLISGADGSTLVTWFPTSGASGYGWSVCGPGDLDGDGVPDVLIGAEWTDAAQKLRGRVDAFSGATGNLLYMVHGPVANGNFGSALGRIGDFDQDGAPDFAVGAPYQATGGAAYLVSGRSGALIWEFDGPDGVENYGRGLSNVARGFDGRIDSDRIPDLVIGAPNDGGSYSQWHGRVDVRRLSDLYLSATPSAPAPGATVTLETKLGLAGFPVGLFAVAFDTTPIGTFFQIGTFNAAGKHVVAGTTPAGLSGHTLTLRSYAIGLDGQTVVDSQDTTIAFQ
jgi:hypothetical protein